MTQSRRADTAPRRVVLLGKNALAVGCLQVLLDAGPDLVEVAGVVADPGDDGTDGWQPSLALAAKAAAVPVLSPERINRPEAVAELRELDPDLLLSCQYAQILRPAVIEVPRMATLNIHFAPLPRYRGVAPIYWAVRNGETEHGVTLHHIDPGVDTGDVIEVARFPIGPTATARDVYEDATVTGIELLRRRLPDILAGDLPRLPQDDTEGLYYNRWSVDYARRTLDWSLDAATIAAHGRALVFPPFQHPRVRVAGADLEAGRVTHDRVHHTAKVRELLEVGDGTALVAVAGGRVRLGGLTRDCEPLDAAGLERLGVVPGAFLDG